MQINKTRFLTLEFQNNWDEEHDEWGLEEDEWGLDEQFQS
jgi:hypothetical protein